MNKPIAFNCSVCGATGWTREEKPVYFRKISRTITIKHNYNPGKNNSLWDYVTDENGYKPYQDEFNSTNGLFLDYFRFGGKTYALDQFLALGNPFWCPCEYSYTDRDGKLFYLSGVDGDNYYKPLYIALDKYGGTLTVWERIEEND